jgi:Fe/S biogenesis protein NfuA
MTDLLAASAETAAAVARIVTVTDGARGTVLAARAGEAEAESLALWLEVGSAPGGKFRYDMWFQARSDALEGDAQVDGGEGLTLVVPAASIPKLRGATLDMAADGSGMVLLNPNEPSTAPAPSRPAPQADLSSPLAQRVHAVLVEQVNPQIASHGGFAELVAAEGDTVWLRMGGGCQGCAMSKATLRQGIEVAIKDAVSEIAHVIDVTDHQSGDNPYYA